MHRKLFPYLSALSLLAYSSLQAEFNLEDAGTESYKEIDENAPKQGPFTLAASGDWVGKSDVHGHHRGTIDYNHQDATAKAIVWYNECYKEGIQVGVSYDHARLNWTRNPFFKKKEYNTFSTLFAFFTHRVSDWNWIASVQYNIDADKWNFNQYSTWDLLLWGRYEHFCNIGIHAGLYAQTGMKLDRVWPVIGFDWKINRKWKLNAIFPLNVSLIYTINHNWALSIAARFFNDRHRAGNEGFYRKALWRYTNGGAEFGVTYTAWRGRLSANLHAGYTLGGTLRISNMHNHHVHHRRFKDAPYGGFCVTLNF